MGVVPLAVEFATAGSSAIPLFARKSDSQRACIDIHPRPDGETDLDRVAGHFRRLDDLGDAAVAESVGLGSHPEAPRTLVWNRLQRYVFRSNCISTGARVGEASQEHNLKKHRTCQEKCEMAYGRSDVT